VKPYYDRTSGIVQFGVAKKVMKAFDYERFRAIVAAAGIARTTFEYSTKTTEPGTGRITCRAELCEPLAMAFVELAEKNKGRELAVPAALAAKAALDVTRA
jgi:hypothetical protein